MLIKYVCPECGHAGLAEIVYSDQKFKCKKCRVETDYETLQYFSDLSEDKRVDVIGVGNNTVDKLEAGAIVIS